MESTWATIDLPVLEAAVQFFEDHQWTQQPQAFDLAAVVGLSDEEAGLALLRLNGEYIDIQRSFGGLSATRVTAIYPDARRAIGQWPSAEGIANAILAKLEAAADAEPDPANRTKMRQLVEFLGSGTRDILVSVLAQVISKGAGVG